MLRPCGLIRLATGLFSDFERVKLWEKGVVEEDAWVYNFPTNIGLNLVDKKISDRAEIWLNAER
jgi:hypothetical protein